MKITYFDRSNLPVVRQRIQDALKGVEEELEIRLKVSGCRFTGDACTFKLEAGTITESGEVMTPEASRFQLRAHQVGLKPTDLWDEFDYNGDRYRIIGMAQKVRRYPIICKALRAGGRFKFSAHSIRTQLERARGAQS